LLARDLFLYQCALHVYLKNLKRPCSNAWDSWWFLPPHCFLCSIKCSFCCTTGALLKVTDLKLELFYKLGKWLTFSVYICF
jgi:hypothetical protein